MNAVSDWLIFLDLNVSVDVTFRRAFKKMLNVSLLE